MLQWSELHPYNAVHSYRLRGPARPEALRAAVAGALSAQGLGLAELDSDGRTYFCMSDPSPEIEIVAAPHHADPDQTLSRHLTDMINLRFSRPQCRPFHFSVVPTGPNSHYVNLTYDHWIADSTAARMVFRNVLARYCHLDASDDELPIELYDGTYRDAFAEQLRLPHLLGATWRCFWNAVRNRSAWRVAYSSVNQMRLGYAFRRLPQGTVDRLVAYARSLGATVHDVILACFARALAANLPKNARCRGPVALGSIVDTRHAADESLEGFLGTFLSYYVVRKRPEELHDLGDLVRGIASVTAPIKERRRYLDSLVNMQFVGRIWPHLREETKRHFMRKALPLTGGISNVALRGTWLDQECSGIVDEYLRVAPTGPMLPIVISPTTLGDQMTIGMSYRITGFTTDRVGRILDALVDDLSHSATTKSARGVRAPQIAMPMAS
jgi:NRPS condensation-like uncharacterized protein